MARRNGKAPKAEGPWTSEISEVEATAQKREMEMRESNEINVDTTGRGTNLDGAV